MFEKIIVFAVIFVLLSCTVYTTVHIVKSIVKKHQPDPEKETLCDTCEHLMRKGGDIEPGKYKCGFLYGSFYKPPEYCRNYEMRKEKKELPEVNADD